MQEYYFEMVLWVSECPEVFADFLIEHTGGAIEEREPPKDPMADMAILSQKCHYIHTQALPQVAKIFVIYTDKDPKTALIPDLHEFCSIVSVRLGYPVGAAYAIKQCKNQDWIQSYQDSITPITCGQFHIRPSWHQKIEGKIDMIIDPALAFGSGHHSSTAMVLQMLSSMSLEGKDVLDVGCGSGILSIGAKKLGARVHLCDTDPLAIDESYKNFALNGLCVDGIWEGSIDKAPQKYDIIIANILADVIKMLYGDFLFALKPQSILILSGILEDYKQSVLDTFKDFRVLEISDKDEWVSIKLTQK
ncbi:ribosomal protein L11 methyltransferase [Helicobacter sp. 12S02634-8]|uniref:50S ribosomal protein L11 methyltransferase n=1 Tax=Helicobacter sp. 12S02634-8 TaxID=1476199 RepID=UPI000BA5308E|nr:50S ribosomal protein L11 methyltransferase [Helicobacter sp. 12S02634-8]PAF46919.1 ribosomal protein L11 methyltransferase [Helicobacter sp. 12S02634-8]